MCYLCVLFVCLLFIAVRPQNYYKNLEYARIWTIKCKFIYILEAKCLLFAQTCESKFGGFLIYKGVPKLLIPYARIWTIKCKFIYILEAKCLLFAQTCESKFGGFLIYKGVPKLLIPYARIWTIKCKFIMQNLRYWAISCPITL